MFTRRRRSTAATASDLPFCTMCGQGIRVDSTTGRCALGHRVLAAVVPAPQPSVAAPAIDDSTTPLVSLGGYVDERIATFGPSVSDDAAWDTVATPTQEIAGLDEFLTWDGEDVDAASALDVDTDQLPVANDPAPTAPVASDSTITGDLLDELDDAVHARRRAVGTIGATIAFTGAVFGSIAILPF